MMDKFEKRTNCEYCGNDMEATNRNKRFCSDKCRVYWSRENAKPKTTVKVIKEAAKRMGKEAVSVNSSNDSTEPKENSMAFFSKYGCMTWEEVNKK